MKIDGSSRNLYNKEIIGESFIETFGFDNSIKCEVGDCSFSWVCTTNGKSREERRWAMGERKAALFAIGGMLLVFIV